ncbi:MAG: DNA-directed RNA polymerase subunit D [Candidatus Bathyarchaeota archaeon]|nr:DNA-directed RNA polymerase subunit D [Candidatus Bathyarchaeota archaeon]
MKTHIISLNEDTLRFLLEGVDAAFANALRRTMVSEVPIMTIEDIFYFDNSSLIPDEIIAHRLGFVPLATDLDKYVLPEECDCEAELGCPNCRAVLTMDVEATEDTITVYSGDLVSEDGGPAPVSTNIPLAKIAHGQAIKFEAYAQLGQGKIHVKWSPVSMCVYQNISLVPITDMKAVTECVEICGPETAIIEGDNLKIINIQSFESCKKCRDTVNHDLILDHLQQDDYLFTVESNGALQPQRIVSEAVKILKKKLDTLVKKIDADDIHEPISDFETPEIDESKLYRVGSGDYDDEEGEESTEGGI